MRAAAALKSTSKRRSPVEIPSFAAAADQRCAFVAPDAALAEWQRMFNSIYPVAQTDAYPTIFARLYEELAELSEAVRVFPSVPSYFLSEAADVFAWLMRVQNLVDEEAGLRRDKRGLALQQGFSRAYPDSCIECGRLICGCPPIPAATIGRIAHEVPVGTESYGAAGRFLPPDKIAEAFSPARLIARHALGNQAE
jgi:NTP pyrophosphatase (non-canonical NTP hydrolase)